MMNNPFRAPAKHLLLTRRGLMPATRTAVRRVRVTPQLVAQAVQELGIDYSARGIAFAQIVHGARIELEHTPDLLVAVKIAVDHLLELPDYYTRLAIVERR